jgi:hypothetical protein
MKSSDSTGAKMNYKPGELKGYGLMFINDTTIPCFKSFDDVEMQGSIGTKKVSPFLLNKLSVRAKMYFLFHEENNRFQGSKIPEIYLFNGSETGIPIRIKPKNFKISIRFKKSVSLPYLKDWPKAEFSKIHEELSPMEVMIRVASYNEWRKINIVNNQ